jgi:hypothetical protein
LTGPDQACHAGVSVILIAKCGISPIGTGATSYQKNSNKTIRQVPAFRAVF